MATAGFRPATVPDLTCSIPTERIQLLSTSLLYCASALRERAGQNNFQRRAQDPLLCSGSVIDGLCDIVYNINCQRRWWSDSKR